MAPEVINHQAYTQAVDWWSYGVILFQMVHGAHGTGGPLPAQHSLYIEKFPKLPSALQLILNLQFIVWYIYRL